MACPGDPLTELVIPEWPCGTEAPDKLSRHAPKPRIGWSPSCAPRVGQVSGPAHLTMLAEVAPLTPSWAPERVGSLGQAYAKVGETWEGSPDFRPLPHGQRH